MEARVQRRCAEMPGGSGARAGGGLNWLGSMDDLFTRVRDAGQWDAFSLWFQSIFKSSSGVVETGGENVHLGLGAGGVVLLDRFIDAGDDDGGVAGVLAGSVDGVFVPGAFGQAGFGEQGVLGLAEGGI